MSRFASEDHQFSVDKENPFIPIYWPIPGEKWQPITEREVPGILPYYCISTYGRIVHIYRKTLMSLSWDGSGYVIALLRTAEGTKTFRVHRLMMLVFRYFEGCEEYVVDHINGDKKANFLEFPVLNPLTGQFELQDNLRWTTHGENLRLAYNDPVQSKKMKIKMHGNASISEEKVREVCKHLEEGILSFSQISVITGVSLGIVQNIRTGRAWLGISSEYTFPVKSNRNKQAAIEEYMVKKICARLQDGKTMQDISKELSVSLGTVKAIRYRKIYEDISKDYDF